MPLRRLPVTILIAVLLIGQAVTAPPLLAAGRAPVAPPESGWSGLVLAGEDEHDDREASSDLRYPAGPTGPYRPRFVRQTGKNCAFASAAMLLDKWTTGRQRPNQARLRVASQVPASQGVSFGELSRAVARVSGIDLRYSPGGGDPLTWNQLMSRLARGGGAVVGGSYSRLPRHYQRWGRDFARLGAAASGHAVYIERFVPGRNGGRVWMMDPLARASGYRGEWISARALRAFAWRNSKGLVTAAATPEPPRLAGYEFAPAQTDEWLLAGRPLKIRLPFSRESGWPKPPELSIVGKWELLTPEPSRESLLPPRPAEADRDNLPAPEVEPELDLAPSVIGGRDAGQASYEAADAAVEPEGDAPDLADRGREKVALNVRDGELVGTMNAPERAGLYRLSLELRRVDGKAFAKGEAPDLEPITLRLRGELAAQFSLLPLTDQAVQGSKARVQLEIANRGSLDWVGGDAITLQAGWETSIGDLAGGTASVQLSAGSSGTFTVNTLVPTRVREGTLRVELIDADGVPLAAYGAEPQSVWLRFASESATSESRLPSAPSQ